MKFFTREMIEGWQGPEAERWGREFFKRQKRYRRQLERLRDRIGPRLYAFHRDDYLHDGLFVSFTVRGPLRPSECAAISGGRSVRKQRLDLTVVKPRGKKCGLYRLKYSGVTDFRFGCPGDNPLDFYPTRGVGYWQYGELSCRSADLLRHNVLFSSGAELQVDCERMSYKREALAE
jgi:hypothetical protein